MPIRDALAIAAAELQTTPYAPPDAAEGEHAIDFVWSTLEVTWVTDGRQHLVAIRCEPPFEGAFGTFEESAYVGTFEGVRVYELLESLPVSWLTSVEGVRWLRQLGLVAGETIALVRSGILMTLHAQNAQTDWVRVRTLLTTMLAVARPTTARQGADLKQLLSPALAQALGEFAEFLISDDGRRGNVLATSAEPILRQLVEQVGPLLPEIDVAIARAEADTVPSDSQVRLGSNLHALAQATIEARDLLADPPS